MRLAPLVIRVLLTPVPLGEGERPGAAESTCVLGPRSAALTPLVVVSF